MASFSSFVKHGEEKSLSYYCIFISPEENARQIGTNMLQKLR